LQIIITGELAAQMSWSRISLIF